MIKGIEVILIDKVEVGKDPFGSPIFENKEIKIENVLVSPSTSDDVVTSENLFGKKAVYTLAIPKNDNHIWEDREVRFFNQTFRTIGFATQGIDELIPLSWNKKIMVELYG